MILILSTPPISFWEEVVYFNTASLNVYEFFSGLDLKEISNDVAPIPEILYDPLYRLST